MCTYMQVDSAKQQNAMGKPESRIRLTVYVRFGEEFSETWSGNRLRRTVLTLQGSHFTSPQYTQRLLTAGVQISMDGKGRSLDNIFTERLWRTIKYEEVYLHEYVTPKDALEGIARYLHFYNHQRLHQSLDYRTPAAVYHAG